MCLGSKYKYLRDRGVEAVAVVEGLGLGLARYWRRET